MLERVRAVPGVLSASLVSDVPLSGSSSAVFYTAEGDTISDAQTMPRAYVHRVSPDFFETVRIPLEAGPHVHRGRRDAGQLGRHRQ